MAAINFPLSPNVGDVYSSNTKSWQFKGYGWKAISASGAITTASRQTYTATAGQTVFDTPTYVPGANQVSIFINGVKQYNSDYVETSNASVTLTTGAILNDSVLIEVNSYTGEPLVINTPSIINDTITNSNRFITFVSANSGSMPVVYTDSADLSYNPSTSTLSTGAIKFPDNTVQTTAATTDPTAGVYANGAFLQSNAAFIQANAAYAAANNVTPQIQPAFNTANAAFIQANAAYNKANTISLTTIFNGYSNVSIVDTSGNVTMNVANTTAATIARNGATFSNGVYSVSTFGASYADGIVMDYITGTGRISVGTADGVSIYNGGPASNALFTISSVGVTTIPTSVVSTSTTTGALVVSGGVGIAGALYVGGSAYVTGDVYTAYSDIRLKEVVGKIQNPLDKLQSIDTFYYRPNETGLNLGAEDKQMIGVSAQSVQNVMPEVVGLSVLGEDYLTVQYERLVPLLIDCIKEQQKQINELNDKVNGIIRI